MGEDPLRRALGRGLDQLGLPAEPDALERWVRLAGLLERWGERINLTGHRGALRIAERLLLEAAALHTVLPAAASVADLGSGAGIPGLPLALLRPEARVRLIEARERRHHFQLAAIRELGLANAEALLGRAEALPARPCALAVSQAFARPEQALAWMRPWLAPDGWMALATTPGTEIETPVGLTDVQRRPYAAPGGPPRALWLARLAS